MKKISSFLTCLLLAAFVNAQTQATGNVTHNHTVTTNAATAPKADISKVLEFKEENHDFGKIPYGKPVEFDVMIKNISQEPVKIENVKVAVVALPRNTNREKVMHPEKTSKSL
jgi:hypothetical protein